MAPKIAVDARLRAWVKEQVQGQQEELGAALEKAGLVKQGQVWVSNYVNGKAATATIDHLAVIARFFERSMLEMLVETGGVTSSVKGVDQGSESFQGGSDVSQTSVERALVSELTVLRKRLTDYEVAFDHLSHVSKQLAEIAAVRQQGSAPAATSAGRRGRRRKTG